MLEESVLNWQSWARNVLHLPAQWEDFYIANALVMLLGTVAVMVAVRWPALALGSTFRSIG